MALAAAQVIDAVAALLVPMAATGGRVYTSRAWPLAQSDLPAWRVFAGDELVRMESISGASQQHTLGITAQGHVRATADLDDAMNDLAAAGLALLFAGRPPYGIELVAIRRQMDDGGEFAQGVISLQMQATFFTVPSAPETIVS